MRTTRQQALQDLYTNGSLTDTGKKSILILESRTGGRNFLKNVKVSSGEITAILPDGAEVGSC